MTNAINNLTNAIQAMQALQTAKTADASKVTNEVNARLNVLKENNKNVEAVENGLKASKMGDAAVEALLKSLNLKKIDINEEEKTIRAEVEAEMNAKAAESFYEGLGEVSMLLSMFKDDPAPPAPKSPAEVLMDLQIMKLTQELAGTVTPTPTPAPAPAPAPVTTVSAPTPAPIATRKELGNELRSISASARADRAEIHADSVSHPFTGNYKRWGQSIFEELADRARARSEYWSNK